jgi:phospho-N-acetylmuramoyl-pentapeptide-transferase
MTLAAEAIRVLGITILSFAVSFAITPFIHKYLLRFGIKKQIRSSEATPIFCSLHAKKADTPTMGGVIIWGSLLILVAVFYLLDIFWDGFWSYLNFVNRAETYLPLAAIFIAAFLGLIDDLFGVLRLGPHGGGLSVRYKLILYAFIGAVGAWWFYSPQNLDWHVLHVPFLGNFDIGIWYVPIFIFIIAASAFSANEADGLDGLLGGISLFAFGALAVVAFTLHRYDLAAMIGAIMGALLTFLWFNVYPAKFFMGDTGSMSLGITLGVITMLTNTTLLLPVFAFPLVVESLSVLSQLVSKKFFRRKIFLSAPIHHHFEALGIPESQITMRFWILSFVFSSLGIVLFFLDRLV